MQVVRQGKASDQAGKGRWSGWERQVIRQGKAGSQAIIGR